MILGSIKTISDLVRLVQNKYWKVWLYIFREIKESRKRRKYFMKAKEIMSSILYHGNLVVSLMMLS